MKKHGGAVLSVLICASTSFGAVVKVPEDHTTISAAIKAASSGDTILIAPGTYTVSALGVKKQLVVASNYINSKDEADIDRTIIKATKSARNQWFDVRAKDSKIIGLTIVGNRKHSLAIRNRHTEVLHCKFIGGKDQLSFEGGGGLVAYCYFDGSGDDAIDADNSIDWIIEHNVIKNTGDDGIEVRLHPKKTPLSRHIIKYNTFVNTGQSGVQIIDYDGDSQREFEIYGNIFKQCRGSGVSCMAGTKSGENYRGSGMVEKAVIYNNTFDGCNYGMTMAPKLIVLNNIFSNCLTKGVGKSDFMGAGDESVVDFCLFYNNGLDYDSAINRGSSILTFDPQYIDTSSYQLSPGSQAVDKGTATYDWMGNRVLDTKYSGSAPDLGATESGGTTRPPSLHPHRLHRRGPDR